MKPKTEAKLNDMLKLYGNEEFNCGEHDCGTAEFRQSLFQASAKRESILTFIREHFEEKV